MNFARKLFAKTTYFYHICVDSDVNVTQGDKAFSDLELSVESYRFW